MKSGGINYDAPPAAGSIRFTDPKLYKREALINERRDEVTYLDALLDKSETADFQPEILQELQTVTTLSAALGMKFDPAAGKNYRRAEEAADVQQEMHMIRLQMQLDQLRRDAELFRQKLAAQSEPSGTVPAPDGQAPKEGKSDVEAGSAETLITAIDKLQTFLGTEAAKTITPLAGSKAARSPIDLFRDRAAYRGLLNSAKNAASLDELHDRDGSALIRLSFSATTLPPNKAYLDTLGLLRMEVHPPEWSRDEIEKLYRDWLDHVNGQFNVQIDPKKPEQGLRENPELTGLRLVGDLFDTAYYDYAPGKSTVACDGLNFNPTPVKGCSRLVLAAPRPRDVISPGLDKTAQHKSSTDLREITNHFTDGVFDYDTAFRSAEMIIDSAGFEEMIVSEGGVCSVNEHNALAQQTVSLNYTIDGRRQETRIRVHTVLAAAFQFYWIADELSTLEVQARRYRVDVGRPHSKLLDTIEKKSVMPGRLVRTFLGLARARNCRAQATDFVETFVPLRFDEELRRPGRVAVYEVGPREQVQQLSTVARASEAIGLAAAISGQLPGNGIGMDGNLAFARSATGKVDALERVPLVVSFAEPGAFAPENTTSGQSRGGQYPAFGWLLGPRMTLDTKGQAMVLEQPLKPYDLSVDLSVPGWWPSMQLQVSTGWAPDWRNGGTMMQAGGPVQKVKVALAPNAADFTALTDTLKGTSSVRRPTIASLTPGKIKACSTNLAIVIAGSDIWRASSVLIGGRRFDSTNIDVLPDMQGVLVKIDKADFPAFETDTSVGVVALTPYGAAKDTLTIEGVKPCPGN